MRVSKASSRTANIANANLRLVKSTARGSLFMQSHRAQGDRVISRGGAKCGPDSRTSPLTPLRRVSAGLFGWMSAPLAELLPSGAAIVGNVGQCFVPTALKLTFVCSRPAPPDRQGYCRRNCCVCTVADFANKKIAKRPRVDRQLDRATNARFDVRLQAARPVPANSVIARTPG